MTEDVLVSIFDFLPKKEKWQLFMSNKTINKELRDHMYYEFKVKWSNKYYTDHLFRSKVLETIPQQQLSLSLSHMGSIDHRQEQLRGIHGLSLYCSSLTDMSMPEELHTLTLFCCDRLIDIFPLRRLHTLCISSCHVVDVSIFRAMHTLCLESCDLITDVSALNQVHTLTLVKCQGITDVSVLDKVHTLTLSDCLNIRGESILVVKKKVQRLNVLLHGTRYVF